MNLRNLLEKRNIKQTKIAKELGISRQSLRYKLKAWEEKRKGFTIDELNKIAQLLEETLNFFC